MKVLRSYFFACLANALLFAVVWTSTPAVAQSKPTREWTVMVYMNAKNNLEPYALANFHSMALVGSSDQASVVAQLGRPSSYRYTPEDGDWSGVYRFLVKKGTTPRPANASVDVGAIGESTDMGSPVALKQFVRWAKSTYPAKRYMLVIWNHGQGWRFQLAANRALRQQSVRTGLPKEVSIQLPPTTPAIGGFRAVSSDDDTGSLLYNRDVQDVIASEFGSAKLDLLGYDACLMAMIETAYGLIPYVNVMVSSEELEPGTGWRYSTWLDKLIAKPTIGPEELSGAVVESYRQQYGDEFLTTLSAVRVAEVRSVATKLSAFADAVRKAGDPEFNAMRKARNNLEAYGASVTPPLKTSVDLAALLKAYEGITNNSVLRNKSADVRAAITNSVIKNYASARSAYPADGKPYGSHGLAIYLPESTSVFYNDTFHDGYLKTNTDKPVDFVHKETWSDLLYKLLNL